MVEKTAYNSALVWRVCINLTLNCMYGGYTTVAVTAALQSASWELEWGESTTSYISLLSSIFAVGAAVGGIAAGFFAAIYGRRRALILADIIGIASCLLFILPSTLALGLGRLVGGFSFGLMLAITPLFLKEMAPPEMSGKTGNLVQLQMCVGNLFGYASSLLLPVSQDESASFSWQLILMFPALLLALQLFALMYIYPYDSPSWLVGENRIQDASLIISAIYKGDRCESEHRHLVNHLTEGDQPGRPVSAALVARRASYYDVLFDWRFRRMLSIGLVLMTIQQWSGINAVMIYASVIFEEVTDRYTARVYALCLGVVNLLAVFLVIPIIDRFGRVPLLWIGQLTLGCVLVLLGGLRYFEAPAGLVIVVLCVYLLIYVPSLGSGIWVYCGEVLNIKSMGATVCFNWVNCFLVLISFQFFLYFGLFTAFWFYSLFCFAGCCFSAYLDETKGLTKEQICQLVVVTKGYTYLQGSQFATTVQKSH
jgi:MFS family permease